MIIQLLAVLAAAGCAYFVAMWVWSLSAHRTMTATERVNAEIEEERRGLRTGSPRERVVAELTSRGYRGPLTPLLIAWGFAYLVVTAASVLTGVPTWLAAAVGAPVTAVLSFGALVAVQVRRRRAFNRQLMQMFDRVAAQLETGSGIVRALEHVLPSLEDPLRSELAGVLSATIASKPLDEAVSEMAQRWPSRAMSMFESALQLNAETSSELAPPLRQASALLQSNYDLIAEAQSELAQTKMEFYVVAGVIAALAFWMVLGGDDTTRSAYMTLAGMIALILAVGNYALGLYRAWRLFSRVREEL